MIHKAEEAAKYGVAERSIQRDIDDLRNFFAESNIHGDVGQELIYDRKARGYRLLSPSEKELSNGEALTVCKILLESRCLRKDEMYTILDKIIRGCVPQANRRQAEELISNEKFYYIEPQHRQALVERLWDIGRAMREHRLLLIEYHKLKGKETVSRLVKPVGLMFSEFYFYLIAFIERLGDDKQTPELPSPTIYRVDRISGYRLLEDRFIAPYKDRFQEGEFRKRIQFMYGGQLHTVRFQYSGLSIEAVLDRLPTAKVMEEKDGVYTVEAEVFGDGVDMWLRSQGEECAGGGEIKSD